MSYASYLQSDHWQHTRERYRASRLKKGCYCCDALNVPLDLHHKTYKTIGHENLNHLCRLCRARHRLAHFIAREKGCHVWGVSKYLRRLIRATSKHKRRELAKWRRRFDRAAQNPIV